MPEQTRNGTAGEAVVEEALEERAGALSGELVRHESAAAGLAAAPQVSAAQLVERLEVIREAMRTAMQEDVDYGRVPGSEKPGLFKPGAEKLSVLFQLDVQPRNELIWEPDHNLTVISRATVYHAPTGTRLGYGEGICSTRERKYAYRRAERRCPECGRATVLKSRDQGGGWFCWRRKGGCGAQFPVGDPRIEHQPQGEVTNPDLPDTWNTVDKMAKKRAYVDATLSVTGASAIFTQDLGTDENEASSEPAAPHGPVVPPELRPGARDAAIKLCGGDVDRARSLWERLQASHDGYMPQAAAAALIHAAKLLPHRPPEDGHGEPAEGQPSARADDEHRVVGVEFALVETSETT